MTTCGDYCQCTHVVKLSTSKVTQIVLMAEGMSLKSNQRLTSCPYSSFFDNPYLNFSGFSKDRFNNILRYKNFKCLIEVILYRVNGMN